MGLLDYFQRKDNGIVNVTKKKGRALTDAMSIMQLDRSKAEISKWRSALTAWESVEAPDRTEMIRLYKEIEFDDQVSAKFHSIVSALSGADFEILAGDKPDPDKTALFRKYWFEKFIKHFVEAEMQGYSLLQFPDYDPLKGYAADDLIVIPREYVQPDRGFVRKSIGDSNGIEYMIQKDVMNQVIGIGDPQDKGLFCNIAPVYIYKKNAVAYWSNYQAKFGIPPIVAKTDLNDETRKDDLAKFLKQMVSNSFVITDISDEIVALPVGSIDGYLTYRNMIEVMNSAISKALEGQTMTADNGSSNSQAQVHERMAESWHLARLRRLESVVNDKLIPKMIFDGAPLSDGDVFHFRQNEDAVDIIDKIVKLSQAGFMADAEWVSEATGIPVEIVQANSAAQQKLQASARMFDFF
jgi:hypothetical protein